MSNPPHHRPRSGIPRFRPPEPACSVPRSSGAPQTGESNSLLQQRSGHHHPLEHTAQQFRRHPRLLHLSAHAPGKAPTHPCLLQPWGIEREFFDVTELLFSQH